jgi:hypothetical protein
MTKNGEPAAAGAATGPEFDLNLAGGIDETN